MRRTDQSLPPPPDLDRPNGKWICGALGQEHACGATPDAKGRCPHRVVCSPRRTWYGRRRPILFTGIVIAAFALAVGLLAPTRSAWVKPGDLSTPHAQILATSLESDRCATCHPNSANSTFGWLWNSVAAHASLDQTDQCLSCHTSFNESGLARSAHNISLERRNEIRLASTQNRFNQRPPNARVNQDNVACGVCHQEHHGADANLKLVTDAQCQTCHSATFTSFSKDHPEWDQWPYHRPSQIAFDHASHMHQHFSKPNQHGELELFDCSKCHSKNERNELTRTEPFEIACASCHNEPLRTITATGLDLVSLPTLPQSVAEQQTQWPLRATGFLDGKISPIAELLFRSDAEATQALTILRVRDLAQVAPDQPGNDLALAALGRATRALFDDIARGGQAAIEKRATAAGVKSATLQRWLKNFPPQLVKDTDRLWFEPEPAPSAPAASASNSQTNSDVLAVDPLLSDPLLDDPILDDPLLSDPLLDEALLDDPLASEPIAAPKSLPRRSQSVADTRFDADTMLHAGGWYRDDVTFSLRYRPSGHADETLAATVELLAQLRPDDEIRQRLEKVPAVAACIECHASALSSKPSWTSREFVGDRSQLTRFSHAPHVNIAQLTDCVHCHRVAPPQDGASAKNVFALASFGKPTVNATPHTNPHQFEHLARAACVSCHKPQSTSESCTTCHQYHVLHPISPMPLD